MQQQITVPQIDHIREEIGRIPNDMMRLMIRIGAFQNSLNHHMNRICEKYDLTETQTKVLLFMRYHQKRMGDHALTARWLEQFCNVSNPTMAGILKRLEAKGYITRVKSSADARNKQIKLIKNIDFIQQDVERQLERTAEVLFRGFSKEDMERIEASFDQLMKNVESLPMEALTDKSSDE